MDKKLFLSGSNKKIGGVCGGIGERYNIDPTVIRILFILAAFMFTLPVIGIYILLWAVLPNGESE